MKLKEQQTTKQKKPTQKQTAIAFGVTDRTIRN
jgi:hypothetical protein